MQKLSFGTKDLVDEKIAKLAQIFPNVAKEGKVDFEALKQELSDYLIDGCKEHYGLNWVGKRASILKANTSIKLKLTTSQNDIILDFFSGSATTDGGNRRFIMVQIPEKVDEKSESFKAGFRTIAEIGRERIIRTAKKIKEDFRDKEYINSLDFGFRYFKVDSSNFKEAKYINETAQENLFETIDNIKPDRNELDLLFEVILNLGLELTLQIETKKILGKKVYFVECNSLIACFDSNVDENLAKELAKFKPQKIVLKDSSFKTDSDKINFEETIKELSPETDIWVV